MRFSCWIPTENTWPDILDLAHHVEASGWDGVYVADHFMPNDENALDNPMHECWSLLAALAASVPRVRLGALVTGNTYRHPAVLMKQAATIDHVAEGRLVLGMGAGWQEIEHERYGIDLGSTRDRLDWFEEACQVMVSLRDQPRTTFDGRRYQLREAPLEPKPVGPLPLMVGASGQKRMAGIVARHADEWNTWSTPSLWTEKRVGFDRALDDIGRDPASLHRSTQALVLLGPKAKAKAEELAAIRPAVGGTAEELVETVGAWADAGLDELIVPTFTWPDLQQAKDALDLIINEVAPAFRG